MARVVGPLMSLSASQTLGGTLAFSQWKGRAYVRLRVDPYNPKSDYQTGIRNTMKKGVMYFTKGSYVGAPAKTWWNTYGEAEKPAVSGFNRFMRAFVALNDCLCDDLIPTVLTRVVNSDLKSWVESSLHLLRFLE